MLVHALRKSCVCLIASCMLLSCREPELGPAPDLGSRDRFGGLTANAFEPGERFRVEEQDGRWWFVTPEGGRFLSFGVNHITWGGNRARGTERNPYREAIEARYGTAEKWAKASGDRIKQWGFNTIGGWSSSEMSPHLPRTPILHLTQSFWTPMWKEGAMPDFFSQAFLDYVAERAKGIDQHAGDPLVVGYFIDNELPWAPDHRKTPELFDGYVGLPADAAGKQRFVALMKERHGTVDAFNGGWKPSVADWDALAATTELKHRDKKKAKADREAFTRVVAEQYFKVTSETIRAKDPGALVMGCRFIPFNVPKVVVEVCGEYCDVVSTNYYKLLLPGRLYIKLMWRGRSSIDILPLDESLRAFHDASGKPVMITEFTSRLKAEGYNNYPPPYAVQPVVKTQAKRAARYAHCVDLWLSQPWCIGAHWFEYADQPPEGRGDGENCTFGLVNIHDDPYEEFVNAVADTIPRIWQAHAESTKQGRASACPGKENGTLASGLHSDTAFRLGG